MFGDNETKEYSDDFYSSYLAGRWSIFDTAHGLDLTDKDETAFCYQGAHYILYGDWREAIDKAWDEGGIEAVAEVFNHGAKSSLHPYSDDEVFPCIA